MNQFSQISSEIFISVTSLTRRKSVNRKSLLTNIFYLFSESNGFMVYLNTPKSVKGAKERLSRIDVTHRSSAFLLDR